MRCQRARLARAIAVRRSKQCTRTAERADREIDFAASAHLLGMIKLHWPLAGLLFCLACGDPTDALAPDSEDELTTIGDRPFTNSLAIPVCFTNVESVYDGPGTAIPVLGTASSHVN